MLFRSGLGGGGAAWNPGGFFAGGDGAVVLLFSDGTTTTTTTTTCAPPLQISNITVTNEALSGGNRHFIVSFSTNPNCCSKFRYQTNEPGSTGWIVSNFASSNFTPTTTTSSPGSTPNCDNTTLSDVYIAIPVGATQICFQFYCVDGCYSSSFCIPVPPVVPPTTQPPPCIDIPNLSEIGRAHV